MPFEFKLFIYVFAFLFGIVIGSFLNVCIYRIPLHETVVTTPSHCMSCGYHLKWYDLVPLFSWLFLKGKCRKCGAKISAQYPIIEGANGVLWVLTFILHGISIESGLYCLAISALLVLSLIDARTMEIPFSCNVFIFVLGVVNTVLDREHLLSHLTGMIVIAGLLFVILLISGGRAIGGGDVKLMFASGLLLGFAGNLIGFMFGCLYASVIHIARMKISKAEHQLAMGPYLAAGLLTAMWFAEPIVVWYMNLLMP